MTKDDVRPYFDRVTCSLRVLGSQLGLEPYELDDLERMSAQTLSNPRQLLVDECFKKEKLTSWHQLATVLEKPALRQRKIASDIRRQYLTCSTSSSTDTFTHPSPLQSLSPLSLESSFSLPSTETGTVYVYSA